MTWYISLLLQNPCHVAFELHHDMRWWAAEIIVAHDISHSSIRAQAMCSLQASPICMDHLSISTFVMLSSNHSFEIVSLQEKDSVSGKPNVGMALQFKFKVVKTKLIQALGCLLPLYDGVAACPLHDHCHNCPWCRLKVLNHNSHSQSQNVSML